MTVIPHNVKLCKQYFLQECLLLIRKFLIEHDEKELKLCIVTLYIEETPDTNISDTSNELKQILVHNWFYILGKAKTYISISHPFRGVLGFIPFPKAIE